VDAARYLCCLAVILGHSTPWTSTSTSWIWVWSLLLPTMPFFFVMAGYFLPYRESFEADLIAKPIRRMLPIFLFWMIVYHAILYVVPLQAWAFPKQVWAFHIRDVPFGGYAYHLWFLPALTAALVLVGVSIALLGPAVTGIMVATLAVVALGDGPYHGLLHLSGMAGTHIGHLAAPLYVFCGVMLRRWGGTIPLRVLIPATIVGYFAIVAEVTALGFHNATGANLNCNYIISSSVVGVLAFLVVRELPASRFVTYLARMGELGFGVYLTHLIFLWLLLPIVGNSSVSQILVMVALVLTLATATTMALVRVPVLRNFVR
jgi:hypothetical protein